MAAFLRRGWSSSSEPSSGITEEKEETLAPVVLVMTGAVLSVEKIT